MRYALLLTLGAVLVMPSSSVAQQWTPGQQEVWEFELRSLDTANADYTGWNGASPGLRFAEDTVTVIVKNGRVDQVTIYYQYRGRPRRRLGRVSPGAEVRYTIPWIRADLQLRVRIDGDSERATNAVTPMPGDVLEVTAHGSMNPVSLRILTARRPSGNPN